MSAALVSKDGEDDMRQACITSFYMDAAAVATRKRRRRIRNKAAVMRSAAVAATLAVSKQCVELI